MPVHSAHVAEELEVQYRWRPYFGYKVRVRRVEQRATGQFLQASGPADVVVTIAGWMGDPVFCAAMTLGSPQVDLAALVDLSELVTPATAIPARSDAYPQSSYSRSELGTAREEGNEASHHAGTGSRPAIEHEVRTPQVVWTTQNVARRCRRWRKS